MPLYEYMCDSCLTKQEFLESATDQPTCNCPLCGSNAFRRIISKSVGLQFKGTGFYITDYTQNEKKDSTPSQSCGNSCSCH